MLPQVTTRVETEATVEPRPLADGVIEHRLVPAVAGSELSTSIVRLRPGTTMTADEGRDDELLFAFEGSGEIEVEGASHRLEPGTASLVVAGEPARVTAGPDGLAIVLATVGEQVDLHAPMGAREHVVAIDHVEPGTATGSRSFQILFGPHNGSTRATLFVGYIPPGRSPWHYHLYDEIVWVWRGPGRFHLEPGAEELPDHAAFRLAPREVHVVENTSADAELVVLGLFTPAGSPSAAYLTAESAASYAIASG
jgi:quercetin dioxygenase-like cupin family protein